MKRSWLVQRLNKPRRGGGVFGGGNPFAFGGGLKNGGLSEDAMKLIRPFMDFDYMGAAEFEYGAVPEAFQKLAKSSYLMTFDMTIQLSTVPSDWSVKNDAPPEGDAEIHVICPLADRPEVITRITQWARGDEELKERTRFTSTLRPHHEWDGDVVGWLELDNGFFFTTDDEMHAGMCQLFALKPATEAATR